MLSDAPSHPHGFWMGAGVRPDSLQGGQNEFGLAASVCVDVPDALQRRVGFACWNRNCMWKAWVVCFLVEAQHRVKRDTHLKNKRPMKHVTVNPLLFLIRCLIFEVLFKILPIIEN